MGVAADGPKAYRHLRQLVKADPVPTFPGDRSSREALGLHLLASALRLEHVDRVIERVSLVDVGHMARRVEIDVDLTKLSVAKLEGLRADADTVWLPIANHPRSTLGPVKLLDGNGNVVTRMTSRDSTLVIGSALVRIFTMLLDATLGTPSQTWEGRQARWLIEGAIARLVRDGESASAAPPDPSLPGAKARAKALDYLAQLFGAAPDHAFTQLLSTAMTAHVVVARVDRRRLAQQIWYDAPELTSRTGHRARGSRDLLPGRSSIFTLSYKTTIPVDVDSFHVTVEVPENMELHHLMLMSDADEQAAASLAADMRNLAAKYDELMAASQSVARFELRSIITQLAALGARRHEDLQQYREYLRRRRVGPGRSPQTDPFHLKLSSTKDLDVVAQRMAEGRVAMAAASLQGWPDRLPEPLAANVADDPAVALKDALKAIASHLTALGTDIHFDNDPREVAGHVQWRPSSLDASPPGERPITATVWMSLLDARPSQAIQVLRFLLASLAIVAVVTIVLSVGEGSTATTPFTAADAIVTVLLLVPGLLLTRLELALSRTVISRVRSLPRFLAWMSVGVTTALAIVVATVPSSMLPLAGLVAAGILGCLLAASIVLQARDTTLQAHPVPQYDGIPRWLLAETSVGAPKRLRANSADFTDGWSDR